MRLISAYVENFALLRNLEIKFSSDEIKHLTVIRGENASGKTSLLDALRWGLFGASGVHERRKRRISSSDWAVGETCPIKVEIDFMRKLHSPLGDDFEHYRIIRTVDEQITITGVHREKDKVSLLKLTDKGAEQVLNPEKVIENDILPIELKDIFIIDGDEAMAFISPQLNHSEKRSQVEDAIRSLLGLSLLEEASKHIEQVERKFKNAITKASGSSRMEEVGKALEDIGMRMEKANDKINTLTANIKELNDQYIHADKKLMDALKEKDYKSLAEEKEGLDRDLKKYSVLMEGLKKSHRKLLESEDLSWALMTSEIEKGFEVLKNLYDTGVIPQTTATYFKERLDLELCICGESLKPGTSARNNVLDLIEKQKTSDEKKLILTELYHSVKADLDGVSAGQHNWIDNYEEIEKARLILQEHIQATNRGLKSCEEKLRNIDQKLIETLTATRSSLSATLETKKFEKRDLGIDLHNLVNDKRDLDIEFKELKEKSRISHILKINLDAAEDLQKVISDSLEEIQVNRLKLVSDKMDDNFSKIIGSQGNVESSLKGSVSGASITEDYDIVVHTTKGENIEPIQLNGASQRALTFSFIGALTEVSGVEAPRIIDTPFGMMAGMVKRGATETVVSSPKKGEPNKQVVLLLTRSEISHIEDILDEAAGKIFTITNTSHFPRFLVNDPITDRAEIETCDCDHHSSCPLCQRYDDKKYNIEFSSITRK